LALCGGDDVIKKQFKKSLNYPFSNPTHRKPRTQISNVFFLVQTRRLHESFEGSYSSLASSGGELSLVKGSRQRDTHAFSDFSEFGGKMGFLGHNFVSRHARRSSKGFIDAGDCLVSKNSLRQNFDPWDWRPGPVKVGQKNENTTTLRAHPRRTPHPNQNFFFLIEPRRLSTSVEGLNTYLAVAAGEL